MVPWLLYFVSVASISGRADELTGGTGPVLRPCPSAPHCVSSQSSDPKKRVAPLTYEGSEQDAMFRLKQVLAKMPRSVLVEERPGYLHFEFHTRLMRFADDIEALAGPGPGVIQIRSSSRAGYYDFGTNRRRVERIRKAFAAADNKRDPGGTDKGVS